MQTPARKTAKHTGQFIRPTADRARESLFNIIGREVENATVLDLYAGTGALGLEALSRAAEWAVFIDNCPLALKTIKKNIELCGFSDNSLVLKRDITKTLLHLSKKISGIAFSIVFVDPPYRKGISTGVLKNLAESDLLARRALVVIEEDAAADLPLNATGLTLVDQRRYGDTGFWFYRHHESEL